MLRVFIMRLYVFSSIVLIVGVDGGVVFDAVDDCGRIRQDDENATLASISNVFIIISQIELKI